VSVTINNSPPPPPPLTITSYTLVNADTGKDLMEMTEGMTLDMSKLPAHLAIRANPAPTNVASIKFGYDEVSGVFKSGYRIESLLPYALFADSNNGTKYNAGVFTNGAHTLVGTPYSQKSGTGTVGTSNTLHFTVANAAATQLPTVTVFQLYNAGTDTYIRDLKDSDTLNLASLPPSLAIRAITQGTVGSVKFGWDPTPGQFNTSFHTESTSPYTLFGDLNSGKDYIAGTFAKGSHTLTGTVYSASGGSGSKLGALTIHFSVT
jgi:hypothetical protein